jgi:hypothetical protein
MRTPIEVTRACLVGWKELYATLYPENISLLTYTTMEGFFVLPSQLLALKEMYLRNEK